MSAPNMLAVLLVSSLLPACVLGAESEPGCRTDHPEDCENGWSCRGGVCVRPTTPLSPPVDAAADGADVLIDAATETATEAEEEHDGGDAQGQG